MLIAVAVVVGILFLAGLVGSVLPVLPGTPLILVGAVLYALATDFTPVGIGRLAILAGLAVVGGLLGYVSGAFGVRRYGGSRWAVGGAVVGAVVGFPFGPLGLLLGPALGAVTAELVRTGRLEESIRTGVGAAIGVVVGAVAHLMLALVMVGLFLWWVWRG